MKSLYLRVWLTVVAVLALFALGSGWLFQRQVEQERGHMDMQVGERMAAWGDLIQRSLPPADAPPELQAAALRDWAQRLRLPLALDDERGERVAASEQFERRMGDSQGTAPRAFPVRLDDGRTLWVLRPPMRGMRADGPRVRPGAAPDGGLPWPRGTGLAVVLVLLFLAVAAGAFPVVRRLTRRLEALKLGVEQFGAGALGSRVDATGRDEVAAVAASFNQAADRIEALVRSHQSLLANASHELRSPLARMKMALSLLEETPEGAARERLKREIHTNIGELDTLVEEVLLASRLDAQGRLDKREAVDLLALAAEEGARIGVEVQGPATSLAVPGDERLLRRALRNLLENAQRYGGSEISVTLAHNAHATVALHVCDRGPGVPEGMRERIFEPFFRMPGHAEREGGVGLGLSLVKQIADRHDGSVRCEARDGGGSCFVLTLPAT